MGDHEGRPYARWWLADRTAAGIVPAWLVATKGFVGAGLVPAQVMARSRTWATTRVAPTFVVPFVVITESDGRIKSFRCFGFAFIFLVSIMRIFLAAAALAGRCWQGKEAGSEVVCSDFPGSVGSKNFHRMLDRKI